MCIACGDARGFMYTGPVYAVEEFVDEFCPWCIADGSAAAQFDAAFTDIDCNVPDDVPAERARRHRPPHARLRQRGSRTIGSTTAATAPCSSAAPAAPSSSRTRTRSSRCGRRSPAGDAQVEQHLAAMDKDGEPTAYLFRCRHCGTHLAYADFT